MTLEDLNELLRRDGVEPVNSGLIVSWERAGKLAPAPKLGGRRLFDLARYDRIRQLAQMARRHQRGRPGKQMREMVV